MNDQNFNNDAPRYAPEDDFTPVPERTNSVLSVISMVAGIMGLAMLYFSVPCGIVAVTLAITERVRYKRFFGTAKAGLICGIIALVIWFAIVALTVFIWTAYPDAIRELIDEMNEMAKTAN